MAKKMRGETLPKRTGVKFSDQNIAHTEAGGYTMQDERRNDPSAKKAHEWAHAHSLHIRNPMWGSGEVVDRDGRIVDEGSLPEFVKEHIAFRSPNQDEE